MLAFVCHVSHSTLAMAPAVLPQQALRACGTRRSVRCGTRAAAPCAAAPPAVVPAPRRACTARAPAPRARAAHAAPRPRAVAAAASVAGAAGGDDLDKMLAVAVRAADAGAEVVRAALDLPRNVQYKGAMDLVTDTDKGSEAAVLAVVQAAFPCHAVLGEEGGVSGDVASEYLWCIDPLDGTTNFTHSYPSFAVSVAVTRRGAPVAAAVVEFSGGPRAWVTRRYSAAFGRGASCNGAPLAVAPTSQLRRALLVTGFGYDHGADWLANMGLFKEFTHECQGVRRLGAASVDLCHVALGVLDGYWEFQLKPWDMAAGALILTEAGGEVTKGDGSPFSVFAKSIVATNGHLHAAVLDKVCPAVIGLRESGFDLADWFIPPGYVVDR